MASAVSPIWIVEPLRSEHDRQAFDCGQPALNEWLSMRAGQYNRKDLARTFVAVEPDSLQVCGYYALCSHRIRYEALPKRGVKGLPTIDIPAILLARLAVDQNWQGRGLGAHLLIDSLRRTERVATQIGVRAVEVDAISDNARAFYQKFGFYSLLDDPRHLFLPIREIRELGLPPLGQ